jgi:hypothetical protein
MFQIKNQLRLLVKRQRWNISFTPAPEVSLPTCWLLQISEHLHGLRINMLTVMIILQAGSTTYTVYAASTYHEGIWIILLRHFPLLVLNYGLICSVLLKKIPIFSCTGGMAGPTAVNMARNNIARSSVPSIDPRWDCFCIL